MAFEDSTAKLQRAVHHIKEIERHLQEFNASDACKLKIERATATGSNNVSLDASAPLTKEIALSIGDCAHNLRSGLDYVTTQFAGPKDERISYPVGKNRGDLMRSGNLKKVRELNSKLADFIVKETEPFEGGKFLIWELTQINNYDKHKLLIPVLNIRYASDVIVSDSRNNVVTVRNAKMSAGSISGLLETPNSILPASAGNVRTEISFPTSTPFAGQPIVDKLAEIHDLMEKAIQALSDFVMR